MFWISGIRVSLTITLIVEYSFCFVALKLCLTEHLKIVEIQRRLSLRMPCDLFREGLHFAYVNVFLKYWYFASSIFESFLPKITCFYFF